MDGGKDVPPVVPTTDAPELDPNSWKAWALTHFKDTLIFAAENPWTFVYTVLLVLSPLFLISAICAYKLAKDIDAKEKEKKKKARREQNIARSRKHAKAD